MNSHMMNVEDELVKSRAETTKLRGGVEMVLLICIFFFFFTGAGGLPEKTS